MCADTLFIISLVLLFLDFALIGLKLTLFILLTATVSLFWREKKNCWPPGYVLRTMESEVKFLVLIRFPCRKWQRVQWRETQQQQSAWWVLLLKDHNKASIEIFFAEVALISDLTDPQSEHCGVLLLRL